MGRDIRSIVHLVMQACDLVWTDVLPPFFIKMCWPPVIPPFSKMAAEFQNGRLGDLFITHIDIVFASNMVLMSFYIYLIYESVCY